MKELSEAQLEAAEKAYWKPPKEASESDRLRAAAPFLQCELEGVTTEERTACRTRYGGMVAGDILDDIMAWLIERRKAALLPDEPGRKEWAAHWQGEPVVCAWKDLTVEARKRWANVAALGKGEK